MRQTMQDNDTKEHPLDKKQEVMTTPKGTDFVITQDNSGLYIIKMIKPGGKVPSICEEKYTGHSLAKQALAGYIISKE
jgi:hypothetical protein